MTGFHLETVLRAVRDRRVTYLHMAPPVAVMLAKAAVVEPYASSGGFRSVVAGVTGGAPLGHEVVVEVYKRCGFRIRLGYGLSETGSTALQRGVGEKEMHAHAGDTGRPHWGVEIMIADGKTYARKQGESTTAAPFEAEGEVLIRGAALLSAYLPTGLFSSTPNQQKPDMSVTDDALTSDGWFRTGDVGALSPDGRLRITDRLKELIKVRAFQVAPAELEAVLCSSPAVADAGVVGVYDKSEATEYPRAYVVPRKGRNNMTPAELEALGRELKELVEKRTTKYKWLVGGIVFVDQIPKSPSGKILRRVLKAGGKETQGFEVRLYEKKKREAKL
jgi:acyl-CoA synthetase (AMP-forming)/AMP-acid ligase II